MGTTVGRFVSWRPQHRVTVFVDDFVRGNLPAISVLGGEPCDTMAAYSIQVDRRSSLWLLLLLVGPVGWLLLAVAHLSSREATLAGHVPLTTGEYSATMQRAVQARIIMAAGLVAIVAVAVIAAAVTLPNVLIWTLMVAAISVLLTGAIRRALVAAAWPAVKLDASRRWVTLSGVHQDFAQACMDWHHRTGAVSSSEVRVSDTAPG